MEYFVVLKNAFAREAVIKQLKSNSLWGNAGYNWATAYPAMTRVGSPFSLPGMLGGAGFGLRTRPRFEDANMQLFDRSGKGGALTDYFVLASRTLVCDRLTGFAYWEWPQPAPQQSVTQQDLLDTAKQLGIEPEAMMAIARQESHGGGFFKDGQPKILFERHRMYALLKKEKVDVKALEKQYPGLVNHVPGGYGPSATQHARLAQARAINEGAALQSASWGTYQVMGENYRNLYASPQAMEEAMRASEKQQLAYFAAFLREKAGGRLLQALNAHQWETVATLYNGSHWRTQNPHYATNIAKYYREAKQQSQHPK